MRAGIDSVLEASAGTECHYPAGSDGNSLPGLWIAARALGFVAHVEDPESS